MESCAEPAERGLGLPWNLSDAVDVALSNMVTGDGLVVG